MKGNEVPGRGVVNRALSPNSVPSSKKIKAEKRFKTTMREIVSSRGWVAEGKKRRLGLER